MMISYWNTVNCDDHKEGPESLLDKTIQLAKFHFKILDPLKIGRRIVEATSDSLRPLLFFMP